MRVGEFIIAQCAYNNKFDYMKNSVIIISLVWLSFILSSCQTREDNYIIKSISFKQVLVSDSLKNNKKYYILNFDVEFCNRVSTWGISSISPGLKGVLHPVDSIRIYDINNRDITHNMRGYGLDSGQYIIINGAKDFVYSPISLENLTKEINNKELSTLGLKITDGRLFESDTIIIPKCIKLYYSDSIISNNIDLIN